MQSNYIGDDDSNSFGAAKQELENKYVDKYRLRKNTVLVTLKKEWVLLFLHVRISVKVLFY